MKMMVIEIERDTLGMLINEQFAAQDEINLFLTLEYQKCLPAKEESMSPGMQLFHPCGCKYTSSDMVQNFC